MTTTQVIYLNKTNYWNWNWNWKLNITNYWNNFNSMLFTIVDNGMIIFKMQDLWSVSDTKLKILLQNIYSKRVIFKNISSNLKDLGKSNFTQNIFCWIEFHSYLNEIEFYSNHFFFVKLQITQKYLVESNFTQKHLVKLNFTQKI